jgi:hypothetical protein
MTFKLGVVGFQKNLKIKETELIASEGLFRAQISFTQGEEFEMSGFEEVEHAYNRDSLVIIRTMVSLPSCANRELGKLLFF